MNESKFQNSISLTGYVNDVKSSICKSGNHKISGKLRISTPDTDAEGKPTKSYASIRFETVATPENGYASKLLNGNLVTMTGFVKAVQFELNGKRFENPVIAPMQIVLNPKPENGEKTKFANEIALTGFVNFPTSRKCNSGNHRLSGNIRFRTSDKDAQGNDRASYASIAYEAFAKADNDYASTFLEGNMVAIEGWLKAQNWTDKDGKKQERIVIAPKTAVRVAKQEPAEAPVA